MKMNAEQMMECVSHSIDETLTVAKELAKKLKPGAVVALHGNLGAGKTTFIKGLALGLGLKDADEVKSPTFAIMHTYPTKPPLYHFDLYRLETEKEISNIGFEEFVSNSQAITCVEWPERGGELIPKNAVQVHLAVLGAAERKIEIYLSKVKK